MFAKLKFAELGPRERLFKDFLVGEYLLSPISGALGIKFSDRGYDKILWLTSPGRISDSIPPNEHYLDPVRVNIEVSL